jgi:CubicO group peptidase (beta-lactamase class C family)
MSISYKIDEYMNSYIELWPFSGAVAVMKNGEIIFNKSYGMACIEHGVPNTLKTKYKIASLTKQITCMGIMILKEKGLLNVQDSIRKYFPDYPEFDERITINHLMTHTSGLFNKLSEIDPYLIMGRCLLTHKEIFNLFKDMPLEYEPDEDWSYCFFGYYLLGVIIERISRKPYIEFIKENIFKPLGMNDSGLDDYIEIISNKASGYYANGERLACCEIDTMSAFSAGAIYSTVPDMLLWSEALNTEKLVSKKSMDEIFTPSLGDYGYGWFIDKYLNRKRARHSGGGSGFNHQFHRYLDDKVSILILSNYGFSNSLNINENIAKIVFNEEHCMPTKPKVVEVDSKLYESYAGIYEEDGLKYEVIKENKKFYFIQNNKWEMPIYPISEDIFHHTWIDKEYVFEKEDNGQLYFNGIKKIS